MTHSISVVSSELRVTLGVCACVCGKWRCGPAWGVSEHAGESHAGCSLGSLLMDFNLDTWRSTLFFSRSSLTMELHILALRDIFYFISSR